jgi:hypothetical protein
VAGFLLNQCKLTNDELGIIEIKTDCVFVAVESTKIEQVISLVNNTKLKAKKVRVYEV